MFKWINEYKTWSIFFMIAIVGVMYLGYINLWEPVLMIEDTKIVAGETVNTTKNIIEFVIQKNMIELIKVLTPILLPIITWRKRSILDIRVKYTTNKVVRDKLGIADRRRVNVTVAKNKRTNKSERSCV